MQNQDVPRSPKPMTIGLPTRPGAYWFQGEGMSRQVLVNVRRKNGELTGWLFGHDVPVAELTATGVVQSHPPLDQVIRPLPNL